MIAENKTCISCKRILRGRADKKFCNDQCRNDHNNKINSDSNRYIRAINYYLRRNRRILANSLPAHRPMIKITRHKLYNNGYRFNYFTHTYTDKQGKLFHFCYDHGFRLIDKEHVMVIRRQSTEDEE